MKKSQKSSTQKDMLRISPKDCFQVSRCNLLTINPKVLRDALHRLKRSKLRYVIKQVRHDGLRLAVFLNPLSSRHRKQWERFTAAVAV